MEVISDLAGIGSIEELRSAITESKKSGANGFTTVNGCLQFVYIESEEDKKAKRIEKLKAELKELEK